MTADDYDPAPHDLRMAREAAQDRRAATDRGLAGVQRHETCETSPEAKEPSSGGLREAVADAMWRADIAYHTGSLPNAKDTFAAMADAAILAMANYPHRGEKR